MMYAHPSLVRQWMALAIVVAAGIAMAVLIAVRMVLNRRPSEAEREARRRNHLATHGRIVDGSLIDAEPSDTEPLAVIYRYRIAGVTYECSQDVSMLSSRVQNLRLDYPVQVRYNQANPADSIVVAETWNGLWTNIWTGAGAQDDKNRLSASH